jgi:hypothetical protein
MNHVADDVPTTPEQNGGAADPQHWNENRRHVSLLCCACSNSDRPIRVPVVAAQHQVKNLWNSLERIGCTHPEEQRRPLRDLW